MRLKRVHVTEYRSIRDSNELEVGDVTCLVGKNESGKTALLEAIYRLRPVVADKGTEFDVDEEYPRMDVEDYVQSVSKGGPPAVVVKATFEGESPELKRIEDELGEGIWPSRLVTLERGYDNKVLRDWSLNETVAIRKFLKDADLPSGVREAALKLTSIKDVLDYLNKSAEQQAKKFNEALSAASALPTADEQAKAKDEANKLQESESSRQLRTDLAKYTSKDLRTHVWETYLESVCPKFLYFDDYYQMQGQLNIEKLKDRQTANKLLDSDRPMLGLIELARLNLDQLIGAKDTQSLLNKLEGASNHLSKQVLPYWSQNKHILVQFDVRPALPEDPDGMQAGHNLWGTVRDTKHLATTRLGIRSRGFVWFFSFVAWFSQQRQTGQPLILLLDEPGLFLHAKGQADLLRYIELELRPFHQVLYTTHSPFMIEADKFHRVRIVRDKSMETDADLPKDEQGTKVVTDVLEADEESLFPLQGALGYDIAQTLFVGPNSLIVEGVSDLLYIQTMTGLMESKGRTGLGGTWTITPVGGADKVPTFVALLGSQKKLKLAVLVDSHAKDQQQIENLYKKKLLEKKNVHRFAEFTGGSEADIEDMFEPQFYLDLVNMEYSPQLAKPIALADLPSGHPRILARIEEYLGSNPLKTGGFNHYRPARYFAENVATVGPKLSAATLDRFDKAFKLMNSLL